ncbi:MAG: response regulator transcription factor [Flavobacteriales bacterium]|nr:response regulator transcription factor [Flavobacteriales bacterium]
MHFITNKKRIDIVIVDDHQIVIDGLLGLFDSTDSIFVKGYTTKGLDAISLIKEKNPHLVLLDINIPDYSGYEICEEIMRLDMNAKVLALSMYDDLNSIRKMLKIGASGYVFKNAGKSELINAIICVHEKGRYLSENTMKLLLKDSEQPNKPVIPSITQREEEVLKLVTKGKQSPEIAQLLHISLFTVKTHRKNILNKLGLNNTAELVRYALENGF